MPDTGISKIKETMMELSRRKVIVTFTVLCLASSVLVGFTYIGGPIYDNVYKFIMSQEASGFRWLFWLFKSPWTDTLVQYIFMLGSAYIPAYLLICWLPKDMKPEMKLSGEDFVVCAVASLGLGYGLNLVGTFINFAISLFTNKSLLDMNPAVEIATDYSPSMMIYACLLGPFMEELMFRGMLLKRAKVFGDRTAVVFTAVMFGLMHGNIAQFLYATAIGLIFGYVTVKTNRLRYSVALHILVNSFSSALSFGEMLAYDVGGDMLSVLYMLGMLGTILLLIIGAIIVLVRFGRHWYLQLTYHNGPPSDYKIFVYLNPGFILYALICAVEFLYYLI